MSTTPDPASSAAGPAPDQADAADAADAADTADATQSAGAVEPETTEATGPSGETAPTDAEADSDQDTTSDAGPDAKSDEERQKSAEEFAAEHDPADHDVAAGEEFRQPGDWTADEAGGPQVFDDEGSLVAEGGETTGEGADVDRGDQDPRDTRTGDQDAGNTDTGDAGGSPSAGGRRVSDLDEVRDGGYSVGSAATLPDGAMPMGHPVKAWEDTRTFVTEDHEHYDEAEPDVWFTDADAAQRAGLRPAD